jgi:trehalose utilization protein
MEKTGDGRDLDLAEEPRVTIWNEYRHEKSDEQVAKIYPEGMHAVLAATLTEGGFEVGTATLDEPEHGLPDEVLETTDVLLWWGHMAHDVVSDETVEKVHERVLGGMGLIVLHSGHFSKIFKKLMGTTCDLKWRHDDTERLWVVAPGHPIAEGLGEYIELEEEMYGLCYRRGRGRIFYFRPGHEENPSYHNQDVQRVIQNAVRWAAPTPGATPVYGHTEPID